jgi:hypothetical protein
MPCGAEMLSDATALLRPRAGCGRSGPGRYSPPKVIGVKSEVIRGNPDPEYINTSYAERHNLTMIMQMRRFTRLTNAFSKKFENHCHALALYSFWYNWVRLHKAHKLTPAMAAGLATSPMEISDIVNMIDASESAKLIEKRRAMLEAAY